MATTRLYFVNFPKTQSISHFAYEHLTKVLGKFEKNADLSAHMHLEIENSREQAGPDQYVCSVEIRSKLFKTPLFLKEKKDNLYSAIAGATQRLSNHMSRVHDKITSRKLRARRKRERLAREAWNRQQP